MLDAIAPFFSRIVAAGIAAGAGYISTKTGLTLTPDQQTALTLFISSSVFGIVHKLIDRKVNPTDAAHPANVAQ